MGTLSRARSIYHDGGVVPLVKTGIERKVKSPAVSRYWRIGPVQRYHYRRSSEELARWMENEDRTEIRDVLDTVYAFTGSGPFTQIYPAQHREELREFAALVGKQAPSTVVEIGTDRGGTLYVWSRYLTSADLIVGMDIDFESIQHSPYSYPRRAEFLEEFSSDSRISTLECNSHTGEAVRALEDELDGRQIDFLFVDGDHTYEGVRGDFERYEGLVSTDGLIAFHDIVPSGDGNGVPQFWREIEGDYETREIVSTAEYDPGPYISEDRYERLKSTTGIGVLYKS